MMTTTILVILLLSTVSSYVVDTSDGYSGVTDVKMSFSPPKIKVLIEDMLQTVICNVTGIEQSESDRFLLRVTSRDSDIADVLVKTPNRLSVFNSTDMYNGNLTSGIHQNGSIVIYNSNNNIYANFTVIAKTLGKTLIVVEIFENVTRTQIRIARQEYSVGVSQKQGLITVVFFIAITIVLGIFNIFMGIKTKLSIVKEVLKRPVQPAIGLCCQFIAMPLLALGISKLLSLSNMLGFGLLAVGASPGGGASNAFTYVLDGDISLSVTMTFISTIISIGMTTFWVWVLSPFYMGDNLNVSGDPALNILRSLALIVPPVLVGILLQKYRPRWAKKFIKFAKPVMIISVIILVPVGTYVNWYVYKLINGKMILCGVLLSIGGYTFGGTAAFIFRQPWKRVRTIAIEVGLQNVGIAMVLTRFSLGQPDGDIAISIVASCAMMQGLPLIIATVCYQIYKKCCKKKDKMLNEIKLNGTADHGEDEEDKEEEINEEAAVNKPLNTNSNDHC